jgi:hypothetical protein
MWWRDWALLLAKRLPDYPIGTTSMPNLLGYLVALIHPRVSFMWVWRRLGRSFIVDASRSTHELGLSYTPTEQTLRDTAASLIARGMVPAPSSAAIERSRALRALIFALLLWKFLRRPVLRWMIR